MVPREGHEGHRPSAHGARSVTEGDGENRCPRRSQALPQLDGTVWRCAVRNRVPEHPAYFPTGRRANTSEPTEQRRTAGGRHGWDRLPVHEIKGVSRLP